MVITSPRNPLVREVVALHTPKGRRRAGAILLEGPTVVGEAVAAGARPRHLFATDPTAWAGTADEVVTVDDVVLAKLATTTSPRGPIAVLDRPRPVAAAPRRIVVWGVADPGNLGTIIRTAAAVGVDVAVGGGGSADPWSPKAVRSGAGAHFRTAVVEASDFGSAAAGRPALALVVRGGETPRRMADEPWALVVGSEAHGLPPDVVADCRAVTLPMPGGTESLNAAVAASVALYLMAV